MTPRRTLLAAAATLPLAPAARAQEAIRLVAAFPPGAALDGIARILAEEAVHAGLGTTVVENRPGANGNIAGGQVARARPDGRTLLFTIDTTLSVNPHLYPDLGYDPAALQPVALAGSFPLALLVHPGTGITTLAELVAAARARPLFYTSGGNGSPGHLAMEALRAALGIPQERLEHVPQRGNAEAIQDLVSGRVQAGFLAVSGGAGLVREGRLRPLAISGTRRMALLPEVPTIPEAGGPAGFDIRFAYLLMAPRGMDAALVARWAALVPAAFARETVRARLAAWAVEPDAGGPAEAAAWVAEARARWGRVVRESGMRLG
jgi:tripartite-type tricarboxylate transporter receptor subunit TctC